MHQNLLRTTPIIIMMWLLLGVRGTAGYVVLSPPKNTVFQYNDSAGFYCSGDLSTIGWVLNGSAYGPVHQQRGITVTLSGTGAIVTSTLYIPASVPNNNTEVICKVADGTFTNVQTSNPSNFTIQGPLDAPYNFLVVRSNTYMYFNLSWGAPFSLNVTNNIEIFNYTLCTNITKHGCKTIPSDPDCTYPRTCNSSVDFTDPSLNGTNKTIMDYGDPIVFMFFAINGAGNGTMANFTYMYNSTKQAGATTQTFPSPTEETVTNATSFTYVKSEASIAALVVGVTIGVIGAVVLIVFSIGIGYILKKKARYPCFSPTDCKPTCTSESQLELQNKVKLDTPCYTDVACLQGITIPAPNDEVQYSEVKAPHTEEVKLDTTCYTDVACLQVITIPAPSDEVKYSAVNLPNAV